jgi:hypothetical protein
MATSTIHVDKIQQAQPFLSPTSEPACCPDYVPLYDPTTNEIFCSKCGCVNADETEIARQLAMEMSDEQKRVSTLEDHMISMTGLLVENGTDHAFRSPSNKGLAVILGSPLSEARDFAHKPIKQQIRNGAAYAIGQNMERNGYFYEKDGKPKFKITYTHDKIYIQAMTRMHQIFRERHRDQYARARAGKVVKSLFATLVFSHMPELIADLADMKANGCETSEKVREAAKARIYENVEYMRSTLVDLLKSLDNPKR